MARAGWLFGAATLADQQQRLDVWRSTAGDGAARATAGVISPERQVFGPDEMKTRAAMIGASTLQSSHFLTEGGFLEFLDDRGTTRWRWNPIYFVVLFFVTL